ncbi:MAG TPA: redox-sensing transcriptional repressor Rex [Gemmatimonadaceae bacterium]|nr:redox-sensing transcriptional repressor Rex [Gemmatimonadaceae bacterium]
MKHVAESTVRRLSLYLRFLEDFESKGLATISSDELAARGGTTSAQVRKDLSLFGSFGKRGLGYSVPQLAARLRAILGLGREWRVVIIGAGKIGSALAQYHGFAQRGFRVVGVYDSDPAKIGQTLDGIRIRSVEAIDADGASLTPDIAVITVPAEAAQRAVDRALRAGVHGVLNFAPVHLQVPPTVALKTVNMAMELEGLAFALVNRSDVAIESAGGAD